MLPLLLTTVLGCSTPSEAETPMTLPEFTATAHTGQARTRADVLGTPTVFWFYPMADTPG